MKDNQNKIIFILGIIPVIWIALLVAPIQTSGLMNIVSELPKTLNNPFNIVWCENSIRTIFIFLFIYAIIVGVYYSTKKNYRRNEEHGSAKWGNPKTINKKYKQFPQEQNKILTQNVSIGYNAKKHRRNLNILVCGGSGAGKTRFYAKPNIMQGNSSFVILDPKGEILRSTGYLLEKKGYDIKILDLINMEKSHCYNPFKYIHTDNDVQKLVTNLFKSTTPKRKSKQRSFLGYSIANVIISINILFEI